MEDDERGVASRDRERRPADAQAALAEVEIERGVDYPAAAAALWATIAARPTAASRARAHSWLQLASVVGIRLGRADEGLAILEIARSVADTGGFVDMRAEIDHRAGSLLAELHRYDESIATLERALVESNMLTGDDRKIMTVNILEAEAIAYGLRGDTASRIATHERAAAVAGELGPDERVPAANAIYNLGDAYADVGRLDEGTAQLRHALDVLGDPVDQPQLAAGVHIDLGELAR